MPVATPTASDVMRMAPAYREAKRLALLTSIEEQLCSMNEKLGAVLAALEERKIDTQEGQPVKPPVGRRFKRRDEPVE